ncbi:MAG: NUDIX domain-containing protein [Gammaproteobacteria bacterium]|nr:NUDIX domain-containing protein [Gammaproteobacteria bacterium]
MGAGVIPFCVKDGQVLFLFHRTFSGRRAGLLVDFGGGGEQDESHRQTAIREFLEETETMYFSEDLHAASLTQESIRDQMPLVESLFDRTLKGHPDWWCRRADHHTGKPRDWKTFFIEFEYRDVADMNREWERDAGARFKKRRELLWVPADTLCDFFEHSPGRLWKRVRQLINAQETIKSITSCMTG